MQAERSSVLVFCYVYIYIYIYIYIPYGVKLVNGSSLSRVYSVLVFSNCDVLNKLTNLHSYGPNYTKLKLMPLITQSTRNQFQEFGRCKKPRLSNLLANRP